MSHSEADAATARGAGAPGSTISVVLPTYCRESVLVDTLVALRDLVKPGDEILLVDQTPVHEPETQRVLVEMSAAGAIRWVRKSKPSQNEAMNLAAGMARGDILLFLDDDIVPFPNLLEGHRAALSAPDAPPATCGQVLQPWDPEPASQVTDFVLRFNFAYDKPCDVVSLMACNFAMRRETYLAIGGMDENFFGSNYRNDAEIAFRIHARTGRKIRFLPGASIRHLLHGGGNRAFGAKDTWGHIGGSIGDYYFAMRWLGAFAGTKHVVKRLVRAPINRNTVRHPWLIPSLALREVVALARAAGRLLGHPSNYAKPVSAYGDARPIEELPR